MGVRWLWQFRVTDVRAELQQLATRITETCGGYLSGKWASQIDLAFRNTQQQQQPTATRKGSTGQPPSTATSTSTSTSTDTDIYRIRLSGEEQHTYLIINNHICECGHSIDQMIHQLGGFQIKVTTMYEGDEYVVGDFIIRIGSVRISKQFQNAVVVDIEYTPCFQLDDCYSLLSEMMSNLACSQNNVHAVLNGVKRINFKEYGLTSLYSSKHAALQYVQATKQMGEIVTR